MSNKGFDDTAFMEYLERSFNGFDNCFMRELVKNIVNYAQKHEHVSKDQLVYFISDMIPEVTFGEVAQFADDDILTASGLSEKRNFIQKNKIA